MGDVNGLEVVKTKQRAWATALGIDLDAEGYCTALDRNLFHSLSERSLAEFAAGDGSELGKGGARGKIQALHSSAALSCNFFEYWRAGDLAVLGTAFGLRTRPSRVAFERKFPTGLGGIAPNMDVVLHEPDSTAFAIESKFTEPYSSSRLKCYLKPKYFLHGRRLWTEVGLPGCQAVAECLRDDAHDFKLLDVSQLLKHMLGLARTGSSWRLCCLWYRVDGSVGGRHQEELEHFSQELGADSGRFTSLTYQDLFARVRTIIGPEHDAWVSYMEKRYFQETAA
jgi:hypothetical protein